jgi:hypothetical protein
MYNSSNSSRVGMRHPSTIIRANTIFCSSQEEFKDTKGAIRNRILKNRQHRNICVTNDHEYVPLVVNTSRSFPHSRLITGFVTRLTRRVPLVEKELPTLSEHLGSPPVFIGVRVTRSYKFRNWDCIQKRTWFAHIQ